MLHVFDRGIQVLRFIQILRFRSANQIGLIQLRSNAETGSVAIQTIFHDSLESVSACCFMLRFSTDKVYSGV